MNSPVQNARGLVAPLLQDGFVFVEAGLMRAMLGGPDNLADWSTFAASWDALEPDEYLAAVSRHRRRRFGVYVADREGAVSRAPHQPHYQSTDYNALQGGIERWFAPITPEAGDTRSLQTILRFSRDLFGRLAPGTLRWHVEVHQFRIEARPGEPGEPTPEGVHRDGVDYVLVLLIHRQNIASGTTTIHAVDGTLLGSFTLTHALDAALVDDARVFHGVTPVTPLDPAKASHRDVLVVTFRKVA